MKPEKITTLSATRIAFGEMETEFSILKLISRVREITNRPYLLDATITRKLRMLRESKEINYRVIDNHRAIYQKKLI